MSRKKKSNEKAVDDMSAKDLKPETTYQITKDTNGDYKWFKVKRVK